MHSEMYQIAVDYPGPKLLSYLGEEGQSFKAGDLVQVPLGKRLALGCVVTCQQIPSTPLPYQYKNILKTENLELALGPQELELYQWMARYYHYPLGQIIFDSLPHAMKRPKKLEINIGEGHPLEHELNSIQKEIAEDIEQKSGNFSRFYIHGVTGSGKSTIYIELIKKKLEQKKSVLFLVPEINLTPQFISLFQTHLTGPIIPFHSGLSKSEKYQIWKFIKSCETPVTVLGVRSSIFLPIKNLGLIIVDEEHDSSFKQNDRCPYNGRDVAIKKSQILDIPIIMGSATPSVENYYNFFVKKNSSLNSHSYVIKERAQGLFPKIEIIDIRKDKKGENSLWPISQQAIESLREVLDKKERALVFVNRLGFANFLQCKACGHKFCDPGSDIPLRYFKNKNMLCSTHSDYKIPLPTWCPECGNLEIWQQGFGTEKIQEVLKKVFPEKIIERFDRDEINNFEKLEQRLSSFQEGHIDILVGTQMLAKGHNFPKVNLVIILGIDSQLNYPDFRAMERTYQLLTQISGRAGRFFDSLSPRVLIQTLGPNLELFSDIKGENFDHFYQKELEVRKALKLSPFSRQCAIFLTSGHKDQLISKSKAYASQISDWCQKNNLSLFIQGPVPLLIEKRQNKFTWCILLQSSEASHLHSACEMASVHRPKGLVFKMDIDPGQIL